MLAIEELARVDASAAIYVDVHNTLVNNCAAAVGQRRAEASGYFPRLTSRPARRLRALRAGQRQRRLRAGDARRSRRATDWELTGRKFWITNGAEAGLFIVFANTDFAKGYKGITGFLVERDFPGFAVGKKENKLGIRASSTTELILEDCRVPRRERARAGRPGLQDRDRDAERGPDRDRRADDRRRARGARGGHGRTSRSGSSSASRSPNSRASSSSWPRWRTELEAARLMVYNAARLKDAGLPFTARGRDGQAVQLPGGRPDHLASALELFGGYGYIRRSTRPRSSTATPRSARSTRVPATCSCRPSPSCC